MIEITEKNSQLVKRAMERVTEKGRDSVRGSHLRDHPPGALLFGATSRTRADPRAVVGHMPAVSRFSGPSGLADNALDTGTGVRYGLVGGQDRCFIEDDGPGSRAAPQEIAELFSIARPLRSSKLLRLPPRGQLGDGLQWLRVPCSHRPAR